MLVTWNPYDKHSTMTLSNGNLTADAGYNTWRSLRATKSRTTEKFYWEIRIDARYEHRVGIGTSSASLSNAVGNNSYSYAYNYNGYKHYNNVDTLYGDSYGSGDIIGVALDLTNGKLWFSKNSVWQASGDPGAGINEAFSGVSGAFFPMNCMANSAATITARFAGSDFSYAPPTGFVSLGAEFSCAGVVKVEGVFASRKVYLHNQNTGSLVGSVTSSGTGEWEILVEDTTTKHYGVCVPELASRNAEVFAHLTGELA